MQNWTKKNYQNTYPCMVPNNTGILTCRFVVMHSVRLMGNHLLTKLTILKVNT